MAPQPHPHDRSLAEELGRQFLRGLTFALGALAVAGPLWLTATPVGTLTSFTDGSTADAGAVNSNFAAVKQAVDSHEAILTAITPTVFAFNGPSHTGTGPVVVEFTGELVDTDNSYNPTTSTFKAKVAGNYLVGASWMSTGGANTRYALFRNNIQYADRLFSDNETYERPAATWIVPLAVDDTIQIKADVDGTSEVSIHANYRNLTIHLIK